MDFESSSSSSSSSSATDPSKINATTHKKRVVRKKTRHPFYRGARRRNNGKWVSEVREPNKKSSLWLGTLPNQEMAAAAHDMAALALHGGGAQLNFPDSAHHLPRPASSSHQDIQRAALQAAKDFTLVSSSSSSLTFSEKESTESMVQPSSSSNPFNAKDDQRKIDAAARCSCGGVEFVDEEAIFNMPFLLDSMAEGMLLTPPAMKKGFNWSEGADDDIDLNLWGD